MADTLNLYKEQGDLTPPSGGGGGKLALTILGICAVLGIAGYFYLGGAEHAPPPPPPDAGTPPPPPKPMLPSPSESDPRVRSLLQGASQDPLWAEYLKQSDLVRVFVSATQNIAQGDSPRTRLHFLAPEGKFEVKEATKRKVTTITVAPASYARYDKLAAVIGSLDEKIVADAYVALTEWIALAFEEIAPRNARFDSVWQAAVTRLVNAPLVPADAKLVAKGALYAYEDPALEGLSAAEKHLLRMGPKNQKVIQDKLKAINEAITAARAATDGGTAMGDGGMAEATTDGGEALTAATDAGATTATEEAAADAGATAGDAGAQ